MPTQFTRTELKLIGKLMSAIDALEQNTDLRLKDTIKIYDKLDLNGSHDFKHIANIDPDGMILTLTKEGQS